uniref:Ribulose-1,5-bisphosphate carboxylase small subunit N-terminal domain-containing protein n=1 Tax=Aegilops tauschii subsp. strangulata TaxID=200361 RepID=A0A453AGE4_AEGTS
MGASSLACHLPSSNTMAPTVMASSATSVAPFQGLKSTAGLPVSRRSSSAGLGSVSNGGRIRCMQVCQSLIKLI